MIKLISEQQFDLCHLTGAKCCKWISPEWDFLWIERSKTSKKWTWWRADEGKDMPQGRYRNSFRWAGGDQESGRASAYQVRILK